MRIARIVIPVFLLAALVTGFLVMAAKQKELPPQLDEGRAPPVVVTDVARHRGTVNIRVDGQVVPYREIDLSAEVAGRVTFKADEARAGRFVEKDTVLFRIDERDYELEVHRLQKQLEQAGVAIQELDEEIAGAQRLVELAQDQVALAQNEYERQAELHRRGVAADSELDKVRRDVITAENALTTVRNQHRLFKTRRSRLEQAQDLLSLQIKKAEHDLARTTIAAPVDGVIVRDSVEQDDFVNVGTPMVMIEDTSAVEVNCNLQMDELYWIWDQVGAPDVDVSQVGPGNDYQIYPTPATVRYRLQEQDYLWKGTLWRIEGIGLDERTRTVPCRVLVDEPRAVFSVIEDSREVKADGGPPALVRGMYVDVDIDITPKTQLFRVPETAVRPGERHERIWLTRLDDKNTSAKKGDRAAAGHKLQAIDIDIVDIEVTADEELGEIRTAVVHAVRNNLLEGDLVLEAPLGDLLEEMPVTPVTRDGEQVRARWPFRLKQVELPLGTAASLTSPRKTSQ
jgi:multidrug efflux pump subunit AcrA (membrane-fusion protein)